MSNVQEVENLMKEADRQADAKEERLARRKARREERSNSTDPVLLKEIQELKECYRDLATRVNDLEIDIEDILDQLKKDAKPNELVTAKDIEKVSNLFLEVVRSKKEVVAKK